jgi:30S ribosomal protein S31
MRPALLLCLLFAFVADAFVALPSPSGGLVTSSALVHRCTKVPVVMGRGDKRTAKGKRKAGSHGNSRLKNGEKRRRAAEKASKEE